MVAVLTDAVAVTSLPTKLIVLIAPAVPTGSPSSWIEMPPIALPTPGTVAVFQVQPPVPFAVNTKSEDPVAPLLSCIAVGFILGIVSKLLDAL